MSSPLNPKGDYILVVNKEPKTKTDSGIYLPEKAAIKSKVVKVVAVGPEVQTIKVGDFVVCKDYTTSDIEIDGSEYLLVQEENIIAFAKPAVWGEK